MTLKQVADFLDCSVSYLSDIELGWRRPLEASRIVALGERLGASTEMVKLMIDNAAAERGAVRIESTRSEVMSVATGFARTAEKLSPEKLDAIAEILRRHEEENNR